MNAAKQIGEHDAGNDEDMLGAVVQPGHGQIGPGISLQLPCRDGGVLAHQASLWFAIVHGEAELPDDDIVILKDRLQAIEQAAKLLRVLASQGKIE